MKLALLYGTVRTGRQSEKVLNVIVSILKKRNVDFTLLHPAELALPRFDDESYDHPGVKKLTETAKEAHAFMVVSPEYNHSFPGVLKDMIDFCGEGEMTGKPLTIVGVSDGQFGGVRMVKELQHTWLGNKGTALGLFLPTAFVKEFDEANPPSDWLVKAEKFVDMSLEAFKKFSS